MTPQPQFVTSNFEQNETTTFGDRIVISGMAGLYPESYDVKQLSEILYNKVNPVKETNRWKCNHPEVAQYTGNIPDLQYFDAQFFKVHYRLCNNMDAMARKILEQAYQAIYDAGLSPEHLSGKKVGVYIGTCFSETEKACFYVASSRTGFGIAGCNKSMFANRISYWLNAKGPSMSIDDACCSSAVALELAYSAISRGDCEAAIVGGTNLCLHPQASVHCGRTTKLSKDGKTKSFDMNASGCAKSEAVNVLFLQKAKDAKRIYAYVVHAKSEFSSIVESESEQKYGFYRNPKEMTKFLDRFYNEANVSPSAVQYIEAFGSAVPEADKSEIEAIDNVFCKSRNKPLLVGSVMSNIGYGEAASGISSVTKVLLGYHYGELASNLHYDEPRIDLPAIKDGRIEILNENKQFDCTYAAVNSMSITGVNAHVLLHGYRKPKDINRYKASIPRLVLLSGRQESSVQKIIQDLKSRPIDPEEHALLHNIHETRITGHLGRGFIILDTNKSNNETESLCEVSDYFDQSKRPLWFVYSGMGSQWPGMGRELMRIPIFAAAIERCHQVLDPKGINIIDIITSEDKNMFDNILHSFVGITAIQIGLTNILRALEIYPDNIIGHSLGEIGCAYADGCFTIEETILCAYSRGLVSIQTPFIRGSMAAVGLGYREISKLCPPEVEVACHNSPDSSTISGPAEVMSEFVASLTSRGIFAKEVPCSNIAYHSRYIADAGPGLLDYMKKLIKTPKLRSERWLSTSVPQDKWDEPAAKYCSAEYHTNNLLSSVLFEETSRLIPADAVLIEIAPHGLLQAILKRSLPQSCRLLPLTRRAHSDCVCFLLEAVGRLSMEGFQPKVKALYPEVEFPVSTSTPMLSHLVEWAHNEKWSLPLYANANRKTASACKFVISTHDDEHSYLKGYVIRGNNKYPFAAALVCVWDTLAMTLNKRPKSISVQFRDVIFHSQPLLHDQRQLRIDVTLQRGTGQFEVMNGSSLVIHGFVTADVVTKDRRATQTSPTNATAQDVYQLFHDRDHNYGQDFWSINSVNEYLNEAQIEWKHNWVTFIDGILQLNILRRNHNGVSKLTSIQNVVIDVDRQAAETVNMDEATLLPANLLDTYDSSVCGGVVLENIKFVDLPALSEDRIVLNTPKYIPFFPADVTDETTALYLFLQVVSDNIKTKEINILEIVDTESYKSEFKKTTEVIYNIPDVKAQYNKINKSDITGDSDIPITNYNLLLVSKLYTDSDLCKTLHRLLQRDTFIINKQPSSISKSQRPALYHVVSEHNVGEAKLELAIWSHRNQNCANMLAIRSPKIVAPSLMENFGGEYYSPCDVMNGKTEKQATLKIECVGDLNSLKWVQSKPNLDSCSGLEVQVDYAGINMADVSKYLETHLYNDGDENKSIVDFSGLTIRNTRVMGMVQTYSIASRLKANTKFLWPVPAHWSLEDAATVPLAYSLAFYILFIKAPLTPHFKVLVQGGTGALGQALISVAMAHGCEVFTTVSNNAKRQFLRKLYPELKDDHIGNSRDISFADTILDTTRGKGCQIVICCSKGELKNVSFKCLGEMGIIIDPTLIPNHEDYKFGMNHLNNERAYITVDLASVFDQKYYKDAKHLHTLMSEGIARGYVRPLSRVTFAPSDVARAFRLQAAGACHGRVLLNLRQSMSHVLPRITCSSSSWQLLISDNEVLTLKLAERLVKQGAKKIVLLLNNPSKYVDMRLRFWRETGVEVKILNNIWEETFLSNVIQGCEKESSLESLLLILSNMKSEKIAELVDNCTRIVQKTSISLKYFSVVTPISLSDKYASVSGLQNIQLPEPMLLATNENSISTRNYLSINNIIASLEKALTSKETVVLAHLSTRPRIPLWQQLLKFSNLQNEIPLQNASNDIQLKDLTKDHNKLLSIQRYLRDICDICLKVEEIEKLSMKSIKEMEKDIMGCDLYEPQGIGCYISNADSDDLLSTTDMVFLKTLTTSSSMRDDEFDATQTYLCIVPGVEGLHTRFHRMCERLKLPAVVLQPGFNRPNETVSEMAYRYAQILLTKTELKKKFYLLGYESGVLVALEMAAILEESGLTGTVYCIGGSPAEILADLKHNLRDYETSEQLQAAVLKHMYTLMTNEDSEISNSFICNNLSWHEKVNACVQTLLGKVQNSVQYAKELIETAYTRLWLLLQYTPCTTKLRSQVISIRPRYSISIDSSLKGLSHQEIISYQLQTPLSLATQDLMCTAIINQHLDADILETFNSKNLCDTYIENANSFMTANID